jgi:signal transduction histidine kinase
MSDGVAGMAAHSAQVKPLPRGLPAGTAGLTPTAVRELLNQQSVLLRLTVHEVRRPLGVVNGYLAMILDGSFGSPPDPTQVSKAVLAMAGAVNEMAALVDGLAAVAQREDLADTLRRRPCQLGQVVGAAVAAVDLEAKARRVRIEQGGPEMEVEADPDHLRVAMVNLLANAIQHSPAGSTVVVTMGAAGSAATIAVADRGAGIDPADVEHVFNPWHRGHGSAAGLGLGLWIVRQIVEWHGGRVKLDSTPGHGSTFSLVLPGNRDSRGAWLT